MFSYDAVCERVGALGVVSAACQISEIKDKKKLARSDGSKRRNIKGIPELVDANDAGGVNSAKCIRL